MATYQTKHGEHILLYRNNLLQVVRDAVNEHHRTIAIRVDLHYPAVIDNGDSINCFFNETPNLLSRFIASLKSKILFEQKRKQKNRLRIHPVTLRYAWVKEFSSTYKCHYHALLFLNKDAYYYLGDYNIDNPTLRTLITTAWCSALKLSAEDWSHLVHYPTNCIYYLTKTDIDNEIYPSDFLNRIDYMTKVRSKNISSDSRTFGCSNLNT